MKRTVFPLAALLLLVASPMTGTAAAQQDRDEDHQWREEPRSLDLERTATQFHFTSERTSELGEDSLDVKYHRETGKLEYRFDAQDPDGERSELAYDVNIKALVEFRSEDGRFGVDADIVERYSVPELESHDFTSDTILQGRGYEAVAEYVIPDRREQDGGPLEDPRPLSDGTLRLEFIMVESPRQVDGEGLVPLDLLMDVHISDHPYTEDDTRIALEATITGSSADPMTINEEGFNQRAGLFESDFIWAPTAQVDRIQRDVHSTVLSFPNEAGSDEYLLMAVYPRGEEVEHAWTTTTKRFADLPDQVVELLTRGNVWLFAGALLATTVLAGWPVMNRLREK